jgi:long-chain acyl-CoA synthetase
VTVAGEVLGHARRGPGRLAAVDADERVTYGELAARVSGCAAAIAGHGGAGPTGVVLGRPVDLIVALLGVQLAGGTPILIDPHWPAGVRRAALGETGAKMVLEGGDAALQASAPPPDDAPDDARWMVFTSGSSATPRPVLRSRRSWLSSFEAVSSLTGIDAGARVLLPGSLTSSLFLFGAMHALWAGACCLFGDDPEGASVAHCVPSMLPRLLGVPLAICGGAALTDRLLSQAAARGTTVIEYYGATELSFVAWRAAGGCLRPFPGVDIEVRDGDEIWVRSPYLADSPLERDERGFATVGDLGHLDAGGALTVDGRGDGLILTGGASVVPEEVERVLRGVPGVADAVVVGIPHPRLGAIVSAVVEPSPGTRVELNALRRAVRAHLVAAARPRRWYALEQLPRTASGKPARAQLRASLGEGAVPLLALS